MIKEKKNKYLKIFKDTEDARNLGDLTGFVIAFLNMIESACYDVTSDIHEKNETYHVMKTKLDEFLHAADSDIAEKYHNIFHYILEKTIFIGNGASFEDIVNHTHVTKATLYKLFVKSDALVYKRKEGREYRWFVKL